jgi:hypothetical protein
MQNNKLILTFFLIIFLFKQSFAIHNEIKVVVGREIITEQDVMNRVNMVAFLSHVENLQILKERKVMEDLMTTLIREKLFAKQAKKNKIIIEKKAVQERLEEILKKSNIDEKSFENTIGNGFLNRETLENFVINEISFREFVVKKIYPKLRSSRYNKELFIEKLNQKLQKSSGTYKIFQFSKRYDKSLVDSINKKVIRNCLEIEVLEKKLGLTRIFVSNFKIDELNPGLRDVIFAKEGEKGIFAYKDENDMNVIGFCQIEFGEVNSIDEKKIDLMYKDHLLVKEINSNYESLYKNNFILIKN